MALNTLQSGILRTYGHTRQAMYTNLAANLQNVAGNLLAIKGLSLGPIAIPVTGVGGVAASTVLSQVLACGIFSWSLRRHIGLRMRPLRALSLPRHYFRQVLKVGVPVAGEGLA